MRTEGLTPPTRGLVLVAVVMVVVAALLETLLRPGAVHLVHREHGGRDITEVGLQGGLPLAVAQLPGIKQYQ